MEQFTEVELENEEWRPVAGYEGLYEVSSLGRVRSIDRVTSDGRFILGKYLESRGATHQSVDLWHNNIGTTVLLHRLVAQAFISNPDNLPEVDHRDNDPFNNRVSNLRWVTSSENSAHRIQSGLRGSNPKGRKVVCLETSETFKSISAAGRSVDAGTQQVIDSIITKSCCKGFTFVYADSMPENPEEYIQQAHSKYQTFHKRPNMKNSRKVKVVESGQIFDSIAEAARFFSCDPATINNRIKAKKAFNNVTLVFEDESL